MRFELNGGGAHYSGLPDNTIHYGLKNQIRSREPESLGVSKDSVELIRTQ